MESLIANQHPAPGFRYIHFSLDGLIEDICYGFEDLKSKKKVSTRTTFNAFSTTKTITSAVILTLAQEKLLDLKDPIKKYIPSYDFSQQVTIEQLLSHQSGLANPIPLKWIHLKNEHTSFRFKSFADEIIRDHLKVKRNPGSKFVYSNLNYLVLGRLIEEITGDSYEEHSSQFLSSKMGINKNLFSYTYPQDGHATGHHRNTLIQRILLYVLINKDGLFKIENSKWLSLNPFYVNGISYGGLFCNPEALMHFCRQFMPGQNSILDSFTKKLVYTSKRTIAGRDTGMSLGWFVGKLKQHPYICHAGGGAGYYAEIRVYPELQKGSVIMFNSSGMRDKRVLDKIDQNYIPKHA